jgi:copper chaperone CopZ
MTSGLKVAPLALLLLAAIPVRAEYLHIQLKVYGLDCELCSRGVSASIGKLAGVESVSVSIKTGLLDIVLARGNKFKMNDLRKRIRQNGFRAMEAKVTAIGQFNGNRFEVLGADESYDVGRRDAVTGAPIELTFDVR